MEIIPLRWYGGCGPEGQTVGFVAVLDELPVPCFKIYVGAVTNATEEAVDAARIAHWGMPLLDEKIARLLAPMCADREYRY